MAARRPGPGGLLRLQRDRVGRRGPRPGPQASSRTAVLAAVIGTTALADGYNLANSTPNVIYDLMLGGVLAATLIPVIVERMEADDQRSIDAIATYVIVALVGVTVLGVALAPLIIRAYAIFKGDRVAADQQIAIAVPLLIMFMPQVLLYGLDTLFTALLNAKRRFAAPAFAPVLNNVVVICMLLAFHQVAGEDLSIDAILADRTAMLLLGIGTTAGIVALVVVLLPAMKAAHIRIRPNWDHRNPALRSVVRLSGWMVGYVVANQIWLWLMKALVNGTGEGRASGFEYAWQFFQLPYGLIAVAVMTAFMPELSSLASRGDRPGYRERLGQGYRLAMVVIIPVTVAVRHPRIPRHPPVPEPDPRHGDRLGVRPRLDRRHLVDAHVAGPRPAVLRHLPVHDARLLRPPRHPHAVHHQRVAERRADRALARPRRGHGLPGRAARLHPRLRLRGADGHGSPRPPGRWHGPRWSAGPSAAT